MTAFYFDERTLWHGGGNYAGTLPVGGLVQPLAAGGLPEGPEAKRRLKSLMDVTGLSGHLQVLTAPPASRDDLARIHPASYLDRFMALSEVGGGEIGLRAPFGAGGYELAALSAGLAVAALQAVLRGEAGNAYALTRPPGHHCLPDWPNGFCLMANIPIAIEAARAAGLARRFAVLDWDVHHGNGTEAIYLSDPEVLTVSLHQAHNYPLDTGDFAQRGEDAGHGANLNIPLPPGTGHQGYLAALERLALPAIRAHRPEVIIIASGYDAGANDPLGRMLATAETFGEMTRAVMDLAGEICGGRILATHEGGYSEVYAPFCAHRLIEELSDAPDPLQAPDPHAATFAARQPDAAFDAFIEGQIAQMEAGLAAER